MGVDLTDCVKAQWPEHAQHKVTMLPSLASKRFFIAVRTNDFPWMCDCGDEGILTEQQVGDLLRANKVTTF